jgi:hypothetical protein
MPLFEVAFSRRLDSASFQSAIEVLDAFELAACRNPRALGQQHPEFPDIWVYEPPRAVRRIPRIALVYTIDDVGGIVRLWNLVLL